MAKDPKKLLKECLRLMLETSSREPFELVGPVVPAQEFSGGFAVYRTFPLVVADERLMQLMRVRPEELEGDVMTAQHEIMIEPGRKGDWTPVSIDGAELSLDDMARLKDYMGPLTVNEMEQLEASSF